MRDFGYTGKLERRGLFPLEKIERKFDRGFKIMRDLNRVERKKLFPLVEGLRTGGHVLIGKRTTDNKKENLLMQ